MIIRKEYKFEAAHIVRKCSTKRCSRSIHGHSYRAEIFIHSPELDEGGMVIDFGLLKPYIRDFLDSFDHTIMVWKDDLPDFISMVKRFSERYIIFPYNPTAENIAKIIFCGCRRILGKMELYNSETPEMNKVIIHETSTGYAQFSLFDYKTNPFIFNFKDIEFSDAIQSDWLYDFTVDGPFEPNLYPDSRIYDNNNLI